MFQRGVQLLVPVVVVIIVSSNVTDITISFVITIHLDIRCPISITCITVNITTRDYFLLFLFL